MTPPPITLLDGGLGQEIFRRSGKPAHPLWSCHVMMEQPEVVFAVHRDFIAAGADVLTINSYTATPARLARDGDVNWFDSIQAKAVELAKQARDAAGRTDSLAIAGCLPPLIGSYSPHMTPDDATCLADFRRIVAAQQDDVDLFLCETMPSIREAAAALTAARESGKPVILGLTLMDDLTGRLRSGEPLAEAIDAFAKTPPDGLAINCSIPETVTAAMPQLVKAPCRSGGYANGFTSVDALKPGGTVDSLSARQDLGPQTYADIVMGWVESGATIIGGCCEVGPGHIAELDSRLKADGYPRHRPGIR